MIGVWLFIAILALWYRRLTHRLGEARGPRGAAETRETKRWRTRAFATALFLLWASLDWPLGPLGAGYFASIHMSQFLAVGVAAPALLLLAIPPAAYERLTGYPRVWKVLEAITHPMAAFCIFTTLMTVSHWPGVVDTFMPTQLGSFVLDSAWLVGGLIFWWPLIVPVPARPGFHPLAKIGYLVLNGILIRPPFAMMIFSEHPIYAIYELAAPPAGNPMDDQQLAGVIMKIGIAWMMFAAVVVVFRAWIRAEDEA